MNLSAGRPRLGIERHYALVNPYRPFLVVPLECFIEPLLRGLILRSADLRTARPMSCVIKPHTDAPFSCCKDFYKFRERHPTHACLNI